MSHLQTTENLIPAIEIAAKITRGPRQHDYAHPLLNMVRIAVRQTLTHRFELKPGLAINPFKATYAMVDLKVARQECAGTQDNVVDDIGYTDMVDRMARKLIEMGYATTYTDAIHFYDGWNYTELYQHLMVLEARFADDPASVASVETLGLSASE